jgi:hypothetical protein
MMLDLPQPLGPTTPTSWPGSRKFVGSTKDLKPDNLIELRRTADLVSFQRNPPSRTIKSLFCNNIPTQPVQADPGIPAGDFSRGKPGQGLLVALIAMPDAHTAVC